MSKEDYTTLTESTVITAIARLYAQYILCGNSSESNYSDLWKFDQIYNGITSAKSPKIIYTTTHSLPN